MEAAAAIMKKAKSSPSASKLYLTPELPQSPVQLRISWSEVQASGTIPAPRAFHTACRYENKIFIFGGANSRGEPRNELFALNISTLLWEQLATSGTAPTRCHHAAVLVADQVNSTVLVLEREA